MTPVVITCLVLSALALIFIALYYPPRYVQGFFVFLLLPVGAGVLPVLVWPGFSGAWPIVYTESRHCSTALLLWLLGIIAAVCTCASVAVIFAGEATLAVLAQLPLTIGVVGIIVSILVLLTWIPLRQRPGLGTCSNGLLVGVFIDLTLLVVEGGKPAGVITRQDLLGHLSHRAKG